MVEYENEWDLIDDLREFDTRDAWGIRLIDYMFEFDDEISYNGKVLNREERGELYMSGKFKKSCFSQKIGGRKVTADLYLFPEMELTETVLKKVLTDPLLRGDINLIVALKDYYRLLSKKLEDSKINNVTAFDSKRTKEELKDIYTRFTEKQGNTSPPFICPEDKFVCVFSGGKCSLKTKIQWNVFRNRNGAKNKKALACFLMLMLDKNPVAGRSLFTNGGMKQTESIFDTGINRQDKNGWQLYKEIRTFEEKISGKKETIIKLK